MRQGLLRYLNNINELRRRSIHLLYLIFLVLIFAFIPSDKSVQLGVDEKDFKNLSIENQELSTSNTILFLHLIQQSPELYEEIKFRAIEIERSKIKCLNFIESLISDLRENHTEAQSVFNLNKEIIAQTKTDSLYQMLIVYKNSITELTNYENVERLDKILPLSKYVQDKHGKYLSQHQYYFTSSAAQSISYLTLLSAQVNQLYGLGLKMLNTDIARRYTSLDDLELMKLSENENFSDLFNHQSLSQFFQQIEKDEYKPAVKFNNSSSNGFSVQPMHNQSMSTGSMIHYKLSINDEEIDKISITVRRINHQSYFSMPSSGDFYFFPQEEGNYIFTFKSNKGEIRDQLFIQKPKHILCSDEEGVLYMSTENSLHIESLVREKNWTLEVENSNGTAVVNNDQLLVTPANAGKTTLKIYAIMPYGKILVCSKSYQVIEQALPAFSFMGIPNGASIAIDDLMRLESASLRGASFEIVSFNCTVLKSSSKGISKTYYNRTAQLQPSIKTLFNSVVRGDKILFDDVALKTPEGKVLKASPYILIVQ